MSVESQRNHNNLSGLEYVQAMAKNQIDMPAMAKTIPMKCVAADSGTVTFTARADARHLNRVDNVHGGFVATVLDSVASNALRTLLEAGTVFATIELNVKFIRPIRHDKDLRAVGKAINRSRQLGIAEAQLFDEENKLCAHCTATFMVINRKDRDAGHETRDTIESGV